MSIDLSHLEDTVRYFNEHRREPATVELTVHPVPKEELPLVLGHMPGGLAVKPGDVFECGGFLFRVPEDA